jgi:hypothetical protein
MKVRSRDLTNESLLAVSRKPESIHFRINSIFSFDNGGLLLNRRDLLTFYGLTLHARTGDNFLETPGNISGQPLQILIDPSASLQIRPGSGTTRIRAAQNVSVDNGEFSIVAGPAAADPNLIWGESTRPGQDLVLENGSVFRVGDSATTLRVGFEFVPGEGVQVDGSTLDVTSFATLSSPLVLRDGSVEVAANGHLVASRVQSTGSSTVRADAAALDTSIDRLDVPSGLLILGGGKFVLAGDNPPIVGTLQLGTLAGGVEILVPDTSIVSNPIVPDRELSFDPGGRLTGQGRIEMSEANHAVAINGGATLAPGLSVGSLSLVGQLFMEDGASVEMEVDTGVLLGGGQIASDTVDLDPPYGDLWLGLGGGTQLQLSILNDTALPEGSRARLFSYPLPDRWNGETFAGLPNGAVFQQGANLWQIRYDDPLVPGFEHIVPTRLVSLTVVAPHLQVLPSPLVNAGAASVGQPASPVTVTLRNAGVVPIPITTLAAMRLDGGGQNADFAFLNDLCTGTTLLANQVCSFDVQLTPSQAGTDVAVFEVNGADEGRFYGEGVPSGGSVTLAPPIRDFGDLAVLDNSVQLFTLTNGSAVDLPSLTLVVHQLAADYTLQADTCTGSLAAGASCTFEIRFQPATTGVLTGVVDVRESGVTVVQAALLGQGSDTSLDVTPSPLAFGDQAVGTSSAPQAVTIQNTGSGNLVVSAINTSSGDYAIAGDGCTGVTVAPGGNCVLQVVFTPSHPGDDPAGLSIASNAAGSPHAISITGRGLAATYTVDRQSIDFGEQQVGVSSAPVRVTLTNTGNEALQIAALTSTSSEFAIAAETCTALLIPVGQTCYFEVVATVASEHRATGAITISSNGWSSPDTVQLSGTGVVRPVVVIPTLSPSGFVLLGVLLAGVALGVLRRHG